MTEDLAKAKQVYADGGYSCVLVKGGSVLTSAERGVKFLLGLEKENCELNGYSAADKVVGRAAALLMCRAGITAVSAELISSGAREIFEKFGIYCEYGAEAAHILNRAGSGVCPMEQAVNGITDPSEAPAAIVAAINSMAAK